MLRGGSLTIGTQGAQRVEEYGLGWLTLIHLTVLSEGLRWPCLPVPGREKPARLSLGLSDFSGQPARVVMAAGSDAASLFPNLAAAAPPWEAFLAGLLCLQALQASLYSFANPSLWTRQRSVIGQLGCLPAT